MPQTLAPIAKALGWPVGRVDAVLADTEPENAWQTLGVAIDDAQLERILTNAMVRAMTDTPSAEIRNAVRIAVDDLRRHGALDKTNDAQPITLNGNT